MLREILNRFSERSPLSERQSFESAESEDLKRIKKDAAKRKERRLRGSPEFAQRMAGLGFKFVVVVRPHESGGDERFLYAKTRRQAHEMSRRHRASVLPIENFLDQIGEKASYTPRQQAWRKTAATRIRAMKSYIKSKHAKSANPLRRQALRHRVVRAAHQVKRQAQMGSLGPR